MFLMIYGTNIYIYRKLWAEARSPTLEPKTQRGRVGLCAVLLQLRFRESRLQEVLQGFRTQELFGL